MSRIAFVLPTYNRVGLLAETLASLAGQMTADDRLIVIDDGSSDGTADFLAGQPCVSQLIRQANQGKAAALNRGIAASDSRYVWILDDDDLLRPGAVARLVGAIEAGGADWVFGRHDRFRDADGARQSLGTGYWPDLRRGSIARHTLEDFFAHQPGGIVRRAAYARVGPFNEAVSRGLDYEMAIRLALNVRAEAIDDIVFDQRQHEGARGPSHARHGAADRSAVWEDWDRKFFASLLDFLPIALFKAMYRGDDPRAVLRAAHLQRACIAARHGLWRRACDDLATAAGLAGLPGPTERAICGRMLGGKYGLTGFSTPDVIERLAAVAGSGPAGARLVQAMLRGGLWRLRHPGPDRAALARALAGLIRRRPTLLRPTSAPTPAAPLEECTDVHCPTDLTGWRWTPGHGPEA